MFWQNLKIFYFIIFVTKLIFLRSCRNLKAQRSRVIKKVFNKYWNIKNLNIFFNTLSYNFIDKFLSFFGWQKPNFIFRVIPSTESVFDQVFNFYRKEVFKWNSNQISCFCSLILLKRLSLLIIFILCKRTWNFFNIQ